MCLLKACVALSYETTHVARLIECCCIMLLRLMVLGVSLLILNLIIVRTPYSCAVIKQSDITRTYLLLFSVSGNSPRKPVLIAALSSRQLHLEICIYAYLFLNVTFLTMCDAYLIYSWVVLSVCLTLSWHE